MAVVSSCVVYPCLPGLNHNVVPVCHMKESVTHVGPYTFMIGDSVENGCWMRVLTKDGVDIIKWIPAYYPGSTAACICPGCMRPYPVKPMKRTSVALNLLNPDLFCITEEKVETPETSVFCKKYQIKVVIGDDLRQAIWVDESVQAKTIETTYYLGSKAVEQVYSWGSWGYQFVNGNVSTKNALKK